MWNLHVPNLFMLDLCSFDLELLIYVIVRVFTLHHLCIIR
jgi:hypothetical protein